MKKIIYAVLAFTPVMALAQTLGSVPTFSTIANTASNLQSVLYSIIPLLFVIALLYFLWGVVQFLRNAGVDPKAHDAGKTHMIYGIIALAVMASVFGLINWLAGTAGLQNGQINLPSLTNVHQ